MLWRVPSGENCADRLVESKKDKLPDEEFIKSSERKAFHRALKKGGKESKKRRIEQVERWQRIENHLREHS